MMKGLGVQNYPPLLEGGGGGVTEDFTLFRGRVGAKGFEPVIFQFHSLLPVNNDRSLLAVMIFVTASF